jgi:hypothetical protein
MKRRRISLMLICIYIFTALMFNSITVYGDTVEGYETVAQNDKFIMSFNKETLDVMITDKTTGQKWTSIPADWEEDTLSSGAVKNNLASHVILDTYDKNDKVQVFNTYTLSVRPKSYKVAKNNKGLSIDYKLNAQEISLSLNFELTEDGFKVTVPNSSIKDTDKYRINQIRILPFFGAAKKSDEGYIFVPDGSGALINFNGNFINIREYSKPVYGWDRAVARFEMPVIEEEIRMPVFGMKKGNGAFLAVIEAGDMMCNINAGVDTFRFNYFRVYPNFTYRDVNMLDMSTKDWVQTLITKLSPHNLKSDLTVKYVLLNGDKANYSGMAEAYRSYLVKEKGLKPSFSKEPYVDVTLIGAVQKRDVVMGVPMKVLTTLTTFKEAEKIIEELKAKGINNINLRLQGYNAGGMKSYWTKKVKPIGKLGGASGLKKLVEYAENNNVNLYLDGELIVVDKSGKGFSTSRDAARFMSNSVAFQWQYNLIDRRRLKNQFASYIVTPVKIPEAVDSFMKGIGKLNVKNVSLSSIGDLIYSDYSKKNRIFRDEAGAKVQEALKSVKEKSSRIMVNGGNAYVFPYVTNITDAPLEHSAHPLLSEGIPFYSMVLHGLIDYSAMPLNNADSREEYMLRVIENGAFPSFKGIYRESSILKESIINDIFSASYVDWIDEAASGYLKLQQLYIEIGTSAVKEHRKLQEGINAVTYENGVTIIVNHTTNTYTKEGINVKAKSFAVYKGGI